MLNQRCTKKWSVPLMISSVNVTKSAVSADLVTFTEEILNGKLHFLCSATKIGSFTAGLRFLFNCSINCCCKNPIYKNIINFGVNRCDFERLNDQMICFLHRINFLWRQTNLWTRSCEKKNNKLKKFWDS